MTDIIEAIDDWTQNRYATYDTKLFGFCELMRKSAGEGGVEQVFPVTIPGRVHVAIDDRYNFITWIRWAQPATYEVNEDWSFGNSEARVGVLPLRIVLAHKTSLGENLVFDFINAFPSKFDVDGFSFVFTNANLSIDPDHEEIVKAELGPAGYIVYEKHRVTWNVYVINVNAQFMECPPTQDGDSIITEINEYIQEEGADILVVE
jgi:hypothetical protein